MKAVLAYIAIFFLVLLLVPMSAARFPISKSQPEDDLQPQVHSPAIPSPSQQVSAPEQEDAEEEPETEEVEPETAQTAAISERGVDHFLILDETTGEVVEVSLQDFVRGAVAAEMPAAFHTEALKAQAVAAHTYALHNHYAQLASPDPALKGADFSADPQNLKVYITEETARDFYGEKADIYWKKICNAADSVMQYVLEYDDEPIVAAYHAISAGQTEDAAHVWEGSAPYLVAAESEGDLLAPDYESTLAVGLEEMRGILSAAFPGIVLSIDPDGWFGEPERSPSGYVTEITVGDQLLHGKEVRQLFDLRSHNFELERTDTGFLFTVVGYGHGVGLSQYGADFLARQGAGFDEILENYYSGAALKQIQLD